MHIAQGIDQKRQRNEVAKINISEVLKKQWSKSKKFKNTKLD